MQEGWMSQWPCGRVPKPGTKNFSWRESRFLIARTGYVCFNCVVMILTFCDTWLVATSNVGHAHTVHQHCWLAVLWVWVALIGAYGSSRFVGKVFVMFVNKNTHVLLVLGPAHPLIFIHIQDVYSGLFTNLFLFKREGKRFLHGDLICTYTVWVKKIPPPVVFWQFSPMVENF